ncbi:hypothetical protein MKX46_02655 [Paenibacillus sp. FSL P4-0113]|uniref:hypothetical protein n=1 Tax=Paenibacillus sp. FSL P4-0113 TaxID=2921630 RepID=UPI0030FCF598
MDETVYADLAQDLLIGTIKPNKTACNEATTANELDREFDQTEAKRFVVSDLTYVKVPHR